MAWFDRQEEEPFFQNLLVWKVALFIILFSALLGGLGYWIFG